MTQTILAIPINDMVSSAITTPTSNQQQLQQQLLYHSTNNVRQKNINRQQLNQICQPSLSLPLNRYFQQHQTTADDTTAASGTPDNVNNDNNNCKYYFYLTVLQTLYFQNYACIEYIFFQTMVV